MNRCESCGTKQYVVKATCADCHREASYCNECWDYWKNERQCRREERQEERDTRREIRDERRMERRESRCSTSTCGTDLLDVKVYQTY